MSRCGPYTALRDPRSEKEVEHAGDQMMMALGFTVIRFSQPRNTMQTLGIPDRRYYHVPRTLAVWWEAKRDGGKQSYQQRAFQAVVERCGESYVLGTDARLLEWLIARGIVQTNDGRPVGKD